MSLFCPPHEQVAEDYLAGRVANTPPMDCPECMALCGPRWILKFRDKFCDMCFRAILEGKTIRPCDNCTRVRQSQAVA